MKDPLPAKSTHDHLNLDDHEASPTPQETSLDLLNYPTPPPLLIKNRRKAYLDRNPAYFSADLESADPLLYDRCVRRFQSAAEREADGKAKGWARVLEADLWRGEARMVARLRKGAADAEEDTNADADEDADEEADSPGQTREEALATWKDEMTRRFLHGRDEDFAYADVDGDDAYDEVRVREDQERWFEDEEPGWVGAGSDAGHERGFRPFGDGETGVQDF